MATGSDIVKRARQRLGIHADEEPLEAHELEKGFLALNDMLYSWVQDQTIEAFKTGRPDDVVHVITKDATTLTHEANTALVANLAIFLADDYGRPITPAIVAAAKSGLAAIDAMRTVPDAVYDVGISYMPSQRLFDGIEDEEE